MKLFDAERNSFVSYINVQAIPENSKIMSDRFDLSRINYQTQRMKIIGEIIELYEAQRDYSVHKDQISYEKLCLEFADVCISICTLLMLQDRKFVFIETSGFFEPEVWIRKILQRETDFVLSDVFTFANRSSLNIEGYIKKKLKYNKNRKDW